MSIVTEDKTDDEIEDATKGLDPEVLSLHAIETRLDTLERAKDNQNERSDRMDRGLRILDDGYKRVRWAHPVIGGGRHVRNAAAVIGLAVIGVGCWWITPALSLIVVGTVVFAGTVAGMVLTRPKGETK